MTDLVEVSPFTPLHILRHSSSFTAEDIANIPDDKIERFKIMFEAMKAVEAAEKSANDAVTLRNDTMKALDNARAAKLKDVPKLTYMDCWRRDVLGKV